jgi:hypothetical protein
MRYGTSVLLSSLLLCVSVPRLNADGPVGKVHYAIKTTDVYATPDRKGEKVGQLLKGDSLRVGMITGDSITVEGKSGRWAVVAYDGKNGHVFMGFLSEKIPALAHTEKELQRIEKENAEYNKKFQEIIRAREEKAQAEADRRGQIYYKNYKICNIRKVNPWPKEFVKGCTEEKIKAIDNLQKDLFISLPDAIEQYGDEYCKGWFQGYQDTRQNLSAEQCLSHGDFPADWGKYPEFPLR